MTAFVLLLIAVVVIALVARAGTKARTQADPRAWLAGRDEASRTAESRDASAADSTSGEASPPVEEVGTKQGEAEEAEGTEQAGEGVEVDETEESLPGVEVTETEDEQEPAEIVAMTTDGWCFFPHQDGVETVRSAHYRPGQFVAARVRPIPDSTRWGLEVLQRESVETDAGTCWPHGGWDFTNEREARAALELLERRIVRPPRDDDGQPRTFSEGDFERSSRYAEQPLPDSEPAGEDAPGA